MCILLYYNVYIISPVFALVRITQSKEKYRKPTLTCKPADVEPSNSLILNKYYKLIIKFLSCLLNLIKRLKIPAMAYCIRVQGLEYFIRNLNLEYCILYLEFRLTYTKPKV